MRFYVYDLETFRNCFLFNGKFEDDSTVHTFEISSRKNQRDMLLSHLNFLQNLEKTEDSYMVGFNTLGFDYPILHDLLTSPYTFNAERAWQMAQVIINSQSYGQNPNAIWLSDRILRQVDLVKINHFDNANRRTSLKSLQFAMRSDSVEDLPYDPSLDLTFEQMDHLISYGIHDVTETEKFLKKCKHHIVMRKELLDNGVLTGDVLNYSDVKIGTEYLVKKIGKAKCYSGKNPKQTFRTEVPFNAVILPKIAYRTEPFNEVLNWFTKQTVYPNNADAPKPKLEADLAGLKFHFGVGGVHASVENRVFKSDDEFVIKDIDVSGMYVAVAIANGFAPEHLGSDFTDAYKQLQKDRAQYPKGSMMNSVLKLAGNGVYGNSNNAYSPFYDPKYTFSVTVNGQLQLLQLVEVLSIIPGLELIQANTDGITALVPRKLAYLFDLWKSDWELATGLRLEEVEYSAMWIRDVNNYVSLMPDGKVKRKGAYSYPITEKDYEGVWNKDFSNLAAIKGVEQVMLNGVKAEDVVLAISNPFDFMLRYKTPSGAKVYIGEKEMLKTVRYYVSTRGEPMRKLTKAKGAVGSFKRKNKLTDEFYNSVLAEVGDDWDVRIHTKNKSKLADAETSIESGWLVKECNNAKNFDWSDVNYDYYIKEINKLIVGAK